MQTDLPGLLIFSLFFTREIIEQFCMFTNVYAGSVGLGKKSVHERWMDVSVDEFYSLVLCFYVYECCESSSFRNVLVSWNVDEWFVGSEIYVGVAVQMFDEFLKNK